MLISTIRENRIAGNLRKLSFEQLLFLGGIFVKQFYLLPSGSLQIGDVLMLCSFLYYFFVKKGGRISIAKDENYFLGYFLFIAIINSIYFFCYSSCGFIKSTLYYFFNLMILIIFIVYIGCINAPEFLSALKKVLQCGLVLQAILFLLGLGKWYGGVRYEGTFNDPNQYGVYILFSALIIYTIGYMQRTKKWIWMILSLLLVLPSASVGMVVGYFTFLGTYILTNNYKKNKTKMILCMVGMVLFGAIIIGLLSGYIQFPSFITDMSIYKRILAKIDFILNESSTGSILADRGWNRILQSPEYILFGAGEGGYDRFGTILEIHSSVLGPLFYYGIIPFGLFITWCRKKIKGLDSSLWCVYMALLSESFFLVNTRQPMFWMLIALAAVPLAKKKKLS